jgi:hypothetical protein
MTTQDVANEFVAMCKEGKWEECIKKFYSPEIKSIEPEGGAWGTVQGLEAIAKKAEEWHGMVDEFHDSEISDPIVAENFFSMTMKSKVTLKGMDHPINMDEICVYEVNDGKVVKEQFFYTPMPEFA